MTNEQALREALQAVIAAHDAEMKELGERMHAANLKTLRVDIQAAIDMFSAIEQARQALALPTAAPVGERELPPLPDPTYIYHDAEQGEDDLFEFSESGAVDEGCEKCKRLYTSDQMRAYARAALSAGDAVDAQRYRWLREQNDDDFAFAVVKNPHFDVYESPEELDSAIDAAMRKGQG